MFNIDIKNTLESIRPSYQQRDYSKLSNDDRKLKETTDAFEAILIKQILDSSLKFEHLLYPKETGSEIYEHLYKDEISKNLSGGFGFSELLFKFLKEQTSSKIVR